jgi:hypothetical protein
MVAIGFLSLSPNLHRFYPQFHKFTQGSGEDGRVVGWEGSRVVGWKCLVENPKSKTCTVGDSLAFGIAKPLAFAERLP